MGWFTGLAVLPALICGGMMLGGMALAGLGLRRTTTDQADKSIPTSPGTQHDQNNR